MDEARVRRGMIPIGCAVVVLATAAAFCAEKLTDEQIRELVPKVKDYRVKFRLIDAGQPVMLPLFDQLAGEDDRLVFESISVLRWIAMHVGENPSTRPPVVATLEQVVKSNRPLPQRQVAARLLGLAGGDRAVGILAPLLHDEKLRDAALAALVEIPGKPSTMAMVGALPKAPAEFRCALLRALGDRHDPDVTRALTDAAKAEDEKVRVVALKALGATQDPGTLSAIVDAMKSGSENVRNAAASACVRLADACLGKGNTKTAAAAYGQVLSLSTLDAARSGALEGLGRIGDATKISTLVSACDKGSAAVKTAAMDACLRMADELLDKGDTKQAAPLYDRVLASAAGEAERMRALAGLGRIADPASVGRIAPLLKCGAERVEAAAASALRCIPGAEATKALSSRLKDAPDRLKEALLAILAERKDPAAIPDIAPLVKAENENIALSAVKALGDIADPSACKALLPVMAEAPFKVKTAAFEAYAAIGDAVLEKGNAKEAMAIYHKILEGGDKKLGRTMALQGLAKIADPASLPLVEPLVDKLKKESLEEALGAFTPIGDKLASQGKRDEAVRIYQKALSKKPGNADSLKQKLRALGEKMEFHVKGGKMTHWWVIGPFPAKDNSVWEKPLPPETEIDLTKEYDVGGKKLRWRPIQTTHKDAYVDLEKTFGKQDRVIAYAYAEIVSKNDQDVFLRSGSDDGLLVWVNGERIFAFLDPRSTKADEDKIKAHLKKGPNQLLLKVCELGGGWAFCMRLTDSQDRNIDFGVR